MNHIIRHSYAASRDGQTVEELLRSQGYSKKPDQPGQADR